MRKKIIGPIIGPSVLFLACILGFLLGVSPFKQASYPGFVGKSGSNLVGISREGAPLCMVRVQDTLSTIDITILDVWIDILDKEKIGNLTEEDLRLGSVLYQAGLCVQAQPNLAVTIVLLDGPNVLADICNTTEDVCVRVVMKRDGIILNGEE